MNTKTVLLALILLILPSSPALALSDLADDFLLACRQLDTTFPPDDWSRENLRDAALEVLDSYENAGENDWAVFFCLITLGHTRYSEDVPRILEYEDTMTDCVLRSLSGFPDPDAIDCLLRGLDSEDPDFRELAIKSIAEINFDELDEGDHWRDDILAELQSARETETTDLLVELIDEVVAQMESSTSLPDSE